MCRQLTDTILNFYRNILKHFNVKNCFYLACDFNYFKFFRETIVEEHQNSTKVYISEPILDLYSPYMSLLRDCPSFCLFVIQKGMKSVEIMYFSPSSTVYKSSQPSNFLRENFFATF
jgi:hypothetical protein